MISQLFQFRFQIFFPFCFNFVVQVICAKFLVLLFSFQNMILVLCTKYEVDRLQDRMSYGYRVLRTQYKYQGSFFAPSCCQSMVSCCIKSVFGSCCSPRHFSEHCLYLFVAMGNASAFFYRRSHCCPEPRHTTKQCVFRQEKHSYFASLCTRVKSDLCDQVFAGLCVQTGNCFQKFQYILVRR